MGFSAYPPHFQARETEQLAMVEGAASRLREYRRLLPSGDLADALDGRFWDAVVLTAANERQALVYARQLDGLHARGQLPGSRDRYVVFPDPPGPRVGSGGATLNVMLRLQATVGHAWASRRILLLHAGGYSERSPAHGTLGKAFGQLPMDAAGVGVPATILEAQLVYLQALPAALPPGVFVSSADVVLQMARLPPLDDRVRERVADGILALGHASPIEIGVGHGVFACDRVELTEFVRRHATAATDDANLPSGTLECLRCLQKPSEAAQRDAGAVMPSPAAMGLPGGGGAEWVLTDSAFHVGWRACDALVRIAAAEPRTFAGVEVCAYGDFMQPMGKDTDDAYLGRVDHVASLAGSAGGTNTAGNAGNGTNGNGVGNGAGESSASASASADQSASTSRPADQSPAGRLRAARTTLARALRGRPLLVLPLLPSRFVHVGTMPELLQHCARDQDVLAALPAAPGGVALGAWDPGCMAGVPGGGSVGADGVWGGGRSSAPGACLLASTLGRGVRVGAGSLIAHCDVGSVTVVGEGCLLHDVDVPKGSDVPPGTFLHCVPLGAAAAAAAGIEPVAVASEHADASDEPTASCWTCIALDVTDEVKRPGKSTLFGVPVEEAARRLGLDPETGDAAWSSDEPRTTTLARLFPVCATAEEATAAALRLRAIVTRDRLLATRTDASGAANESPGLRVSVGEALRSLADHPAAVARRDALRRRAVAKMVARLLERNTPTDQWMTRAPPLRCLVAARSGDDEASATIRATEAAALDESGVDAGTRRALAAGRIALALAPAPPSASAATKAAEATARRCLRAAIVGPFVESPPAFGRPAATAAAAEESLPPAPAAKTMAKQSVLASVRAEYPARLNLAGGWTDTPPYSLERRGAVLHVAVLTAESAPPAGDGAGNGAVAGNGAGAGAGAGADATAAAAPNPNAKVGNNKTTTAAAAAAGDASSNASNAAGVSSAGRLRRAISATATRLPGAPGIVRLVSEPGPGVPGRSEEIKTVEELLAHDDPTHPFALARACASLALVPSRLDAGLGEGRPVSSAGKPKPAPGPSTLVDALRAFLGAPGFGLEIRTRVDLPRGSGLGTSSILGLAILHATHELSTGCAWTPGDAESGAGAARWAGRSAIVPHPESKHADEASKARAEAAAEAATEARGSVSWPSARVAFNAVLAVEQLMTTGGGWQDQIGGALEGARLTVSVPGDFAAGKATADAKTNADANANVSPNVSPGDVSPLLGSLPEYEPRVAALPPAAAAFLSRHVACVFTGACRLAATVARGVVDAWQRRAVGVEDALRACAAIGAEMTDALDRLGALPNDSFAGAGSEAARAELDALGNALERHKAMQEKLWPSITSPAVRALYDAVAPLARGSHICGAGNGGHVVVFLAAGKTPADVAAAVAGVAEAPEAKVVRVQMMLGGGVRKTGGGAETGPNKRQRTT